MIAASAATFCVAYVASVTTTVLLYPYRDYVKAFKLSRPTSTDYGKYVLGRYRGMLTHPSQPLMLAAPNSLLYMGFVLGHGGIGGVMLSGLLGGYAAVFVSAAARNMSGHGGMLYASCNHTMHKSVVSCVLACTRRFGIFSFFVGGFATALITALWHGVTLLILRRSYRSGFVTNFFDALRTHALMTLISSPFRNTFRSALYSRRRSCGVFGLSAYIRAESAVMREAAGVIASTLPDEGIRFLFHGVIRSIFKTSVPFAFTYALFVAMGGSLGKGRYNLTCHYFR